MKSKINSLTSLRFFAAAMIVVLHSWEMLGWVGMYLNTYSLVQGVSFFFVLSGFILTYVYPTLNTREAIGRFFIARFARIWPAHLFSFILLFRFNVWNFSLVALTNLIMVHSWIPLKEYFFSFNSVSWSISTEFFFYLCFPILIYKWKQNWLFKIVSAFLLLMFLIYYCNVMNLPAFSAEERGVTTASLVYINPLGRIFEFVLGMTAALFWEKYAIRIHLRKASATTVEVISIILTITSLRYSKILGYHFIMKYLGRGGADWFAHNGTCFIFALLIFVLALNKGIISKLLSFPLLVLLGEISFSIYLIHQIIIRYYITHFPSLGGELHPFIIYFILWVNIIFIAYIMWYFIERPSRKLIVNLWPKRSVVV